MRKLFQQDLYDLGDQLSEMAVLVHQAIVQATEAFETTDIQLAEKVISADQRIDALQTELDEKAIELLLLQGPVAADLRLVVGALRMSASMERMGDLARHIAQLVQLRYPEPMMVEPVQQIFAQMARKDIAIAAKIVDLLVTRNPTLVAEIHTLDGEINQLHSAVFGAIAAADWTATASQTADTTLTSRYLERFADHGVSITEKVSYLVTGQWESDLP